MKLIGFLIIAACLILGLVSATTAYLPRLDLPDEQLVGLKLNGPAGEARTEDMPPFEKGTSIAEPGAELTVELLAELRDNGVDRVQVKEFSLARWSGKWFFLLAAAGLLAGATLVRMDMRRRLAASSEGSQTGTITPEATLATIAEVINVLRHDLPHMTTAHDRVAAMIERLGEVQAVHVPAFVDAREKLVSKHGMSGYAAIMDRFAAMERQINRAWSAAADGVEDEATDCLERASALAQETQAMLEKA